MKISLLRFFLLIAIGLLPGILYSQVVVTSPALPTDNVSVKITFDATKGTAGLKDYTGEVYAHTGVLTDKSTSSTDWKYVKTSWGTNTPETKLTRVSANIYELNITPNIREYYGVPEGERILKMAFVFRSSDSKKEGKDTGNKDIFADVFEDDFVVDISNSENTYIKEVNTDFIVTANANHKGTLSVLLNGDIIKTLTDTTAISDTLTLDTAGDFWIKVTGDSASEVSADSIFLTVYGTQAVEPVPAGMRDGINYVDNTTVTLVLYAPEKKNVYLIGDFNNWLPQSTYQMKKDGDRYWYTLTNLTTQKEYIFQYLVDGSIRIADPYSEKISDPANDKYISTTVYPGLIAYPSDKTSEIASVIQTGQTSYVWQNTSYTIPEKKDLIIYELLIRDFTAEGTIKAAKEKLSYLKELGVNAVELMPFSEFEGNISWGYNPNFYFATDKAYGTKNDYKEFIDACHANGMIVIQDIVLNHTYGSSPMVRLYWDAANNQPAANNPWYNVTSPNSVYSWGNDFNHESAQTKQFVDSVNRYWLSEFKVDGFRFDFTKGFTNTPGDGSAYDASRIAILKRMADEIWEANPNALVILEHFAPNNEEMELASHNQGMMIWGNANYNFSQASMGFHDAGKSNFSMAAAANRGYTEHGLVTYMESHDEERIMYNTVTSGNSAGAYDVKAKKNAVRRAGQAATFLLSIPGPKMIWQFGELGYDVSINYNNDRTGVKPLHWEYLDDTARYNNIFKVYKAMIGLRKENPVFTEGTITTSVTGATKKIHLNHPDMNVTLLGNFDVYGNGMNPEFQHTGTWYEFFTGKQLEVTSVTQQISLQPGEYRLYTDKYITPFITPTTDINDDLKNSGSQLLLYPVPVKQHLNLQVSETGGKLDLYNVSGQNLKSFTITDSIMQLPMDDLKPGLYFIKITNNGKVVTGKFLKE